MRLTEPITLIHGWASDPSVWEPLLPRGARQTFWPSFSKVETKDGLLRAASAALPDPPALLIGWSLGAMLALELALAAPARVRALVLFGGTPRFVCRDRRYGWPKSVLQRMRQRLTQDPQSVLAAFQKQMFSPGEQTALRLYRNSFPPSEPGAFSPAGLQAGLDYLAETDLTRRLPELQCPALWIHGAADRICPVGALEALPASHRKRILPGTGHVPFWTQPESCTRYLEEFDRAAAN